MKTRLRLVTSYAGCLLAILMASFCISCKSRPATGSFAFDTLEVFKFSKTDFELFQSFRCAQDKDRRLDEWRPVRTVLQDAIERQDKVRKLGIAELKKILGDPYEIEERNGCIRMTFILGKSNSFMFDIVIFEVCNGFVVDWGEGQVVL